MLKEVLDIIQLLEGQVTGNDVAAFLTQNGADDVQVKRVEGAQGHTDFVHLSIAGTHGRKKGTPVGGLRTEDFSKYISGCLKRTGK